ncbi:hypothetical protein LOY85_22535, partial [Brevibacillus brevis]|uniref:hypothetical protein n=1 Tax=Brevibacillus brevis TaxID=1393 RepID=UPI001F346BB7
MNLTKRFWKQFFSFALIFSVLFSGQSIGHAEEQYTENVVPVMTSDTSPSGKASASRVFNNNFAYYAFDDRNKGSFWYSDKVQSWLEYEFETPKRIEKYAILPKWEILAPKNFTFEAWNGTEWIVLDTQNLVSWRSYEKKEFVFTNSASYNRYRINITKGFDNSVVGITEFEMMENANPTNPDPNPNPDPGPD